MNLVSDVKKFFDGLSGKLQTPEQPSEEGLNAATVATSPTDCTRCRHHKDLHLPPIGNVVPKHTACIGSNCTCHCPGYNDMTSPTLK